MSFQNRLLFLFLTAVILVGSSCVRHPELLNFSEGPAFPSTPETITNSPKLILQADDLISIRVKALDEETTLPFNVDLPNVAAGNINANSAVRPMFGYLVSAEGTIDFPILGTLEVAGKSIEQVRVIITEKLEPYLKDPVVIIRFLNFRVTVLGEVLQPSTFFFANERVTVLDALGQAGDLTPYANRTNVLIIREVGGERQYGYLNLQDRSIFKSDFFYLRQNDVIYVEPLEEKTASLRDQSQRILPWLSVITSLTTLVITLTR